MKRWRVKVFITLTVFMFVTGCGNGMVKKSHVESINPQPYTEKVRVSGVRLVETMKAQAGKLTIPYKKYRLDNGLTVVLHMDHSDPLVHVDVTYHVGSAREEPGKSGFAHFFEHMMFQGSQNVADEQHFKLITEAGGKMNGSTNSDRTNYYQTVPANQLEKVLWLESDRMGFLLDAVTQKKFEVQRETVKNERGQRIDNRPYGRLHERVAQALYPAGHPYSWPVIGYMEDLNSVDVNDLKAFFLRWYGPNNATLTIGGDFNEQVVLAQIVKYFGPIPKGPVAEMPEKPLVTLADDRYISMEDNVQLPLIYFSLPTVHARHEDEAPLDVLAEILGQGKTSILYKNLVKTQYAVHATVTHPCAELACTFNFQAFLNPASGKSLADLEKVMRAALDEFEKRGIEDDDLLKVKAKTQASIVFSLQSVAGKVSHLAYNQTFFASPDYAEKNFARYSRVTKADVRRVYRQYIKNKPAVIMSVVPNGQSDRVAVKDNFAAPKRKLTQNQPVLKSDIQLRVAKDNFDRSKIPVAQSNKPVQVPQMWRKKLANGIEVLGTQSSETPTTSLLLKVAAGQYYETPAKAGTAALLARMLSESTTRRSGEMMSLALQKLGSLVNISSDRHYLTITVDSLTKNLSKTLSLVHEMLMNPAFDEGEFSRVKNNTIQYIKNRKKDADYLATAALGQLLYGDTIAAMPNDGKLSSVHSLTPDDIKLFYQTYFKPANGQIILVSDLKQKALEQEIAVFGNWKGSAPALDLSLPKQKPTPGVIYLVHKDNAAQSVIRIGKRAIKRDMTGEFYQAYLMNFPFGGAFNSRINLNLREDKGYTYGAVSYLDGDKLSGEYVVTAKVRSDVTDKSLLELIGEMQRYHKSGITTEELSFLKLSINQRDALAYETPNAKLDFLSQILEYNLTPDFVKQRTAIVNNISVADINKSAKKYLNIKEVFIVVVGNAKVLKPQLEALGYRVQEVLSQIIQ